MNEKGVYLDDALNWLAKYNDEVLSKFQAQLHMLPSWNPDVDRVVNKFVERLSYWIRECDCWSFESRRYFGTKRPEIKKHRLVTLLPKVTQPGVSPMLARWYSQVPRCTRITTSSIFYIILNFNGAIRNFYCLVGHTVFLLHLRGKRKVRVCICIMKGEQRGCESTGFTIHCVKGTLSRAVIIGVPRVHVDFLSFYISFLLQYCLASLLHVPPRARQSSKL